MRGLVMKKSAWLVKVAPLICAASVFIGGCVAYTTPVGAGGEVEVAGAPPALIAEDIPPSPGAGYVWIGGAWDWQGRWVWGRGHWDRPPHPGAIWVPHRYVEHNGKHTFVRGGWR
jgi:hypothetical protein